MGLISYIEEKRLERERAIRNEKLIDTMKFLAGVGAGFTLGILFAPKSGKETRKAICDATKNGIVAEKYDELTNETIPEKIEDFEEKVHDTADKVEEKAENVKEKVKKW